MLAELGREAGDLTARRIAKALGDAIADRENNPYSHYLELVSLTTTQHRAGDRGAIEPGAVLDADSDVLASQLDLTPSALARHRQFLYRCRLPDIVAEHGLALAT